MLSILFETQFCTLSECFKCLIIIGLHLCLLVCVLVAQSYPTLCDSMDCSPPGSSVHGVLQARVLEWLPFPSPGDLPNPGVEPGVAQMVKCLPAMWERSGFNSCIGKLPWRRKWQPTPVLLPRKSHGWSSLLVYSPWSCKESDTIESLLSLSLLLINLWTLLEC